MAIVVESTATAFDNNESTVTITKPTGVVVGDLLVAVLSATEADGFGVGDWATLSGWSLAQANTFGGAVSESIQYKIADSGDVAASNFTFSTSVTVNRIEGAVLRCSGAATAISVTEALGHSSTYSGISANSGTFAGTLTPYTPPADGALAIAIYGVEFSAGGAARTFSGYSFTSGVSSPIELYDGGTNDGSGGAYSAAAYGIQTTAAELSAYGASISASSDDHYGTFAVFIPTVDATGTNTLVTTTAVALGQSGTCDTTGANVLSEATAEALPQSGQGIEPTTWTTTPKS